MARVIRRRDGQARAGREVGGEGFSGRGVERGLQVGEVFGRHGIDGPTPRRGLDGQVAGVPQLVDARADEDFAVGRGHGERRERHHAPAFGGDADQQSRDGFGEIGEDAQFAGGGRRIKCCRSGVGRLAGRCALRRGLARAVHLPLVAEDGKEALFVSVFVGHGAPHFPSFLRVSGASADSQAASRVCAARGSFRAMPLSEKNVAIFFMHVSLST